MSKIGTQTKMRCKALINEQTVEFHVGRFVVDIKDNAKNLRYWVHQVSGRVTQDFELECRDKAQTHPIVRTTQFKPLLPLKIEMEEKCEVQDGFCTNMYTKGSKPRKYAGQFKGGNRVGYGVDEPFIIQGHNDVDRFIEETFSGEFASDMRNGHGTVSRMGKAVYQGQFKDDKKHGNGVETELRSTGTFFFFRYQRYYFEI